VVALPGYLAVLENAAYLWERFTREEATVAFKPIGGGLTAFRAAGILSEKFIYMFI